MEYNDLIYNSGPVKFNDYVFDKYNIVHNQLYEYALNQYVNAHISNIVLTDILYSLFLCMNNCITQFNDINALLNNIPDNIYSGDTYKVYTINEVNQNNICNENYISELVTFIHQSQYNDKIFGSFNEISNDIDSISYIKYIVSNIVILINTLSYQMTNIFNTPTTSYNVSNFIIRYDNVIYILNEDDNTLLETENQSYNNVDEIFIFEKQIMSDIHIGFNNEGKFIIDIDSNKIPDISNVYDTIYFIVETINKLLFNTLFDELINKYINAHKIIEIKKEEYWMPSSIIIFEKTYPHKKHVIDLTPYWSTYQDSSDISFTDKKIIKEPLNDSEIEHIDYIKGKVNMYSKLYDIHYKVPTKYIDKNTNINDNVIKNTFINRLKNFD